MPDPIRAGRASSPHDARRGQGDEERFGPYVLRSTLAHGGMASVHLATRDGPDGRRRVVALKRIHPHLASEPDFGEMFLDEAQIASRIVHPRVCTVIDYGKVDGVQYLVMEHLFGESLRDVLALEKQRSRGARARLDRMLVSLLADACDGLHAAHELVGDDGRSLEVVHRDVSPHNFVVTYDGRIKIIDFGIARAAERSHHTATGVVKGKFAYMAPEQMRGQIVDRRADVWSLGVVLWESLAGRSLFRRATDSETILAVSSATIPDLREVRPELPEALASVVRRALSRERDARIASAHELGGALREWLATSGPKVEAREVAAFMAGLCPHRRAAKKAAVDEALAEPEPFIEIACELGDDPTRSAVIPSRAPPSRLRRGSGLRIASATALLVALGALLLLTQGGDDAAEGAPIASPPTAAPSAGFHPESAREGFERAKPREEPLAVPEPRMLSASSAPSAIPDESRNARSVVRSGQVNIAARGGWANVHLGARRLGPTPGTFALPEGRHLLTFRDPHGQVVQRRWVTVHAGRVARMTVELSP